MSKAPWYPEKQNRNKRSICPICVGWRVVNDQRTNLKRMCAGCGGVGRIKRKA